MMLETLSNIGVYWLTAISTSLSIAIVLKARWWTNLIRIALSSLILGFALTGWYITGRRWGWLGEPAAAYAGIFIFGGFALWLTVLFFLLMKYNWFFWAWSHRKEDKT